MARKDNYVDIPLNFTELFAKLGEIGELDRDSLRVIEVDELHGILDTAVPFQFDPDPDFDPAAQAAGTMTLFLSGETAAEEQRLFHIYFDRLGGTDFTPAAVSTRVFVTDGVVDEEQESFEIVSSNATYYYHKEGGGFSSLVDVGGNDWISYNTAVGSKGEHRGIPNLPNYFHPGKTGIISTLISAGPLKATIQSVVLDENMVESRVVQWQIYPEHAVMTILKAPGAYWFLYEGTPGGSLEVNSDFIVRSDGTNTKTFVKWDGPITGGEWLYFSDPLKQRSLYFAHHEQDTLVDSYWAMNKEMTVFGFGREGIIPLMNQIPASFTMGFADQTDYEQLQGTINAAYRDLAVTVGDPQARE